jgi:hypothetical protein
MDVAVVPSSFEVQRTAPSALKAAGSMAGVASLSTMLLSSSGVGSRQSEPIFWQ